MVELDKINKSIDSSGTVEGTEAFELVDKVLYNIDKVFQDGIKNTINYFNTTNIVIYDVIEYKTKTPNINDLYKLRGTLQKHMEDGDMFSRIGKLKAPVLTGLDVTLLELYTILESISGIVGTTGDALKHLDSITTGILNSAKDNVDFRYNKSKHTNIDKNAKLINDSIVNITSNNKLSDRRPINMLTKSMKEIDELTVKTIKLGSSMTMENLEYIHTANTDLTLKLNTLHDSLKKDGKLLKGDDVKKLVNLINSTAKLLTATTFTYYIYYQLVNMLVGIIKIMDIAKEDHTVIDTIGYHIKSLHKTITKFEL